MISPIPHMFFYTFISMKEPLLGIDGMVCAVRFRGGVDHVSKFQIENQIEIQFQMSIELDPYATFAALPSRHAKHATAPVERVYARIHHVLRSSVSVTFIARPFPLYMWP